MCGKYPYFFILLNMFAGSPPRVREVLSLKNVIIRASGITPRVCGKYKTIKKRNGRTTGITPACAGSIIGVIYSFLVSEDHPRVCGKSIY